MKKGLNNFLGNLLGLESCLNCGDSSYWKPMSLIESCARSRDDTVQFTKTIGICNECRSPTLLNIDRITAKLKKLNWESSDIEEVQHSILVVLDYMARLPITPTEIPKS